MSEDKTDTQREEVPTEKEVTEKRQIKKTPVFARPVTSNDFFTPDAKKKFDELPNWQRHLLKRLIDHGDIKRAAREAGVSKQIGKAIDVYGSERKTITEELEHGGITSAFLVTHLLDCLEARTIKYDKHQNPVQTVDLGIKLKSLELLFKLRGDFEAAAKQAHIADELFEDTPIES